MEPGIEVVRGVEEVYLLLLSAHENGLKDGVDDAAGFTQGREETDHLIEVVVPQSEGQFLGVFVGGVHASVYGK
ncbi:hypothetical protein DAETH_44780 (plasmid) [Deinococcus aetherius]|uniref:Uncharacterized protein n=1 Tax=Deinococcus aetherius TaxID=200252 RepID=A0ABN6RNM5_9DEIO|nr:hypothetical protein DAETH_44780 [Deinococcus aetherius]